MQATNLNQLSEKLLLAVKMRQHTSDLVSQLERISLDELFKQLPDDTHKKAFWINMYNAFFQLLRKEQGFKKPEIYTKKQIVIASERISLDDIEHGILRRYRYKYSLGFVANIFASRLIKKLAVDVIDYRIHFALNCGAKSCPPISFYSVDLIDQQLELATQSFLESETDVFDNELHVTMLFKWFLYDFGGVKGIKSILNQRLNLPNKSYKLIYKEYSWEEALDNYDDANFTKAVLE